MTVDPAAVKAYMKIDGEEEDTLLDDLIGAAEGYLASLGIRPPPAEDRRYVLAVSALALQYYEHRSTEGGLPPALDRLITQLKIEGMKANA